MSASESGSQPNLAPVTELGRVLRELLRREAEIDRRELADGGQQNTELWRQTNLQAIDGIELAIASLPATGLAEAVVQLLIAGGYADQVAEELDDPRLREPVTRLLRLLRSALPVVAEAAGVELADYAPARYAQGEQDRPLHPADAGETPEDRSASAEPRGLQATTQAPTPRYRPSRLRLVEPQLDDTEAAAREDAAEEADEPRGSLQNEIVMPILDMIFAEAGCFTKRRVEQD